MAVVLIGIAALVGVAVMVIATMVGIYWVTGALLSIVTTPPRTIKFAGRQHRYAAAMLAAAQSGRWIAIGPARVYICRASATYDQATYEAVLRLLDSRTTTPTEEDTP